MRQLRLLSATAAILLLGVSAVSAQGTKTNETTAAPSATQQNAPTEKTAPVLKSDKQVTTDKGASAGAMARDSSADRTAHNGHRRHFAGRHEGGRNGPYYDSYRGHHGYRGCREHGHRWTLGLWC